MSHRSLIERLKRTYAFRPDDTNTYDYDRFVPFSFFRFRKEAHMHWLKCVGQSIQHEITEARYNGFNNPDTPQAKELFRQLTEIEVEFLQ